MTGGAGNSGLGGVGGNGGNASSLSINGIVDDVGSLYIIVDTDDDEAFALAIGGKPVSVASTASVEPNSNGISSTGKIAGVRALTATGAGGSGGSTSGLLAIVEMTLAFVTGGFGLRRRRVR